MPKVFISYRRSDSASEAGRLFDDLEQQLGTQHVYKDVDSIAAGADFRSAVIELLEQSDVVLSLIGPAWLDTRDAEGNRRLDQADDMVRMEIATSLATGNRVVPVLVRGATMPASEALPNDIAELAYRNALPLRPDPDFRRDCERLLQTIGVESGRARRKRALWIGAAAVLLLGVGLYALQAKRDVIQTTTSTPAQSTDQSLARTTITAEDFTGRFATRLQAYGFPARPTTTSVTPDDFADEGAQASVDAAPAHSILYLRSGNYFPGSVEIDKPLVLLCEDAFTTRLLFSQWSLGANSPANGPVWIVNCSISYTGNDYLMYSLQARGHTVASFSRIDSTSPYSPWLIQGGDRLTVEHSVLNIRADGATGMSLFAGELPGQAVVEVRNSCLVATGERNFFAFPAADEQPAGDLRLTLERNVFYSVDTSEAKTAFFFVRGEGEPAVDIELQRNIFAGTQPDGLLDLMMGRRNDKSVYAPDLNVPPDCYLSPDDTFGTIDSKRMGPVPIAEAMP